MADVEPPKKFALHFKPANSTKVPSQPQSARTKRIHPPLNVPFPPEDAASNAAPRKKNPRNKRKAPRTARTSNPRFHSKNRKASSPPKINSSGTIKNPPLTPDEVKNQYISSLTRYEIEEISIYDEIYFLGHKSSKIKSLTSHSTNHGYDDINHHYKANVGDQIAYRFEIRAVLGKGAFGQVLRCLDHKTKKNVALKMIVNTDQMREQGQIEISLLQHLNSAPNHENSCIIQGYDYFIFRNHICATFEILGQNLYEYLRATHFKPFSMHQLKSVAKDILTAIAFIHQNHIIHCDLKPENILLCAGSTMNARIIDFGSSCVVGHQKYEYIQSRFYRAPEVILGSPYGPPIDIWSFACTVAELAMGNPIFPGDDEAEQLEMIMEVFGIPPVVVLNQCSRRRYFFDVNGRPLIRSQVRKRRKVGSVTLKALTRINDPLLLDLLTKCFQYNQNTRITAADALKHPFFTSKEVRTARPMYQLPGLHNWK